MRQNAANVHLSQCRGCCAGWTAATSVSHAQEATVGSATCQVSGAEGVKRGLRCFTADGQGDR